MQPKHTGDPVREPRGEQGRDDTEEVVEEWDYFCDEEGEEPDGDAGTDPDAPAEDCVGGHVAGGLAFAAESVGQFVRCQSTWQWV